MHKSKTAQDNKEALVPMNHHCVQLPVFEGPLDLLLFLIRKNEIDIYDIPIEKVTHQYLATLGDLEQMDLELTGEFFVMAATLMVIKSRLLLPKKDRPDEAIDDEALEENDPRWELVQQLLEYKKIKEESQQIGTLMEQRMDYLPRALTPGQEPKDPRPLKNSDKMDVWRAFNQVLHRFAERITVGEIHDEQVTVAERMDHILERLSTQSSFYFSSLFKTSASLNMVLSTFLALLELGRLSKLCVEQTENFEDILCSAVESVVN